MWRDSGSLVARAVHRTLPRLAVGCGVRVARAGPAPRWPCGQAAPRKLGAAKKTDTRRILGKPKAPHTLGCVCGQVAEAAERAQPLGTWRGQLLGSDVHAVRCRSPSAWRIALVRVCVPVRHTCCSAARAVLGKPPRQHCTQLTDRHPQLTQSVMGKRNLTRLCAAKGITKVASQNICVSCHKAPRETWGLEPCLTSKGLCLTDPGCRARCRWRIGRPQRPGWTSACATATAVGSRRPRRRSWWALPSAWVTSCMTLSSSKSLVSKARRSVLLVGHRSWWAVHAGAAVVVAAVSARASRLPQRVCLTLPYRVWPCRHPTSPPCSTPGGHQCICCF
jgi:hypothetical protein